MELKKGYKLTEIGVIPEDWLEKEVKDVASIAVGKDLVESSFSIFFDDTYKYPVYSNTVSDEGLYGFYDFADYTENSITIVGRGIGLGTAFKRESKFGAIGRLLVAKPFESYDFRYLTYFINYKVKIHFESGGIPQLTGVSFGKYKVTLPPTKAEQTAIATALSDADALITSLEKLIEKKLAIKQGAMQQLLKPKEGWVVKKLDRLCSLIGDGIHTTPKYSNSGDYFFVNGNNLKNSEIVVNDDTKRVSKGEFLTHQRELNTSTVLLSINGTIGNLAFYTGEKIVLGKSAAYINVAEDLDKRYLFYILQTEFIKQYFENELTGSTIKNLGLGCIRNAPVRLPSNKSQQIEIANMLSDMDAEISSLEGQLAKCRMMKQGMVQELLTGKTRLI